MGLGFQEKKVEAIWPLTSDFLIMAIFKLTGNLCNSRLNDQRPMTIVQLPMTKDK